MSSGLQRLLIRVTCGLTLECIVSYCLSELGLKLDSEDALGLKLYGLSLFGKCFAIKKLIGLGGGDISEWCSIEQGDR
ncbi:Uncharacterized protein HZ326_19769 [Fusarium oxysporum f. sp. albedinis]|nr:Uncharacterized protein HZ326_19769 [Fusarium oxysporum f. sp. albedinis]